MTGERKRRDRFSQDHPPSYGKARRLWDWYTAHKGHQPVFLYVTRPGWVQQAAGACHYVIQDDVTSYLVWNVEQTLLMQPQDAEHDWRTGDRNLA